MGVGVQDVIQIEEELVGSVADNKLPHNWTVKKLGEVAKFIDYRGRTPKKTSSGIPLITAKNVKRGFINEEPREYIAIEDYDGWMTRGIPKKGDVLITTEAPLGNVAQLKFESRIALAQRLITLQAYKCIDSSFLLYNLMSPQFQEKLNSKGTGTTVKGIKSAILKQLEIPLPPLFEQQAIIAKIEQLFSELDKGKQQLETALQQLKIYRQAVLKWAFEGKFTNTDVKEGELPEGWKWVKLGEVANKITDGEHATPRREASGILLLSARNIQNGFLDLRNVDYVPEDEYQRIIKRCHPEEGDILISCSGSIGRISRVPANLKFTLVRSVALIKLNHDKHCSRFYEYLFQASILQKQIEKGKKATAQANLFLGPIKNLDIIECEYADQEKVVQEIESRLSVCDKVEETITQSLQQAEVLRQTILKKAFEGKF